MMADYYDGCWSELWQYHEALAILATAAAGICKGEGSSSCMQLWQPTLRFQFGYF